jgi:glycosyltransferase involved in cell wall biosynthesis
VGGLPEVIEDGVSGILCDDDEEVCLGSLGAALLQDDERYQAMAKAARAHAERFDRKPVIDAYEQALTGLIAGSDLSPPPDR